MSRILARCLGVARAPQVTPEALAVLIARSSPLSRAEAYVVALDYLGMPRADIAATLHLALDTPKAYFRRAYHKTGCPDRASLRAWVEGLIAGAG